MSIRRKTPMVTVSLALDMDTYNMLTDQADKYGISLSAVVRAMLNGKQPEARTLGANALRGNYSPQPTAVESDGHAMTAEERREFFQSMLHPPVAENDPPEDV